MSVWRNHTKGLRKCGIFGERIKSNYLSLWWKMSVLLKLSNLDKNGYILPYLPNTVHNKKYTFLVQILP